MSYRCIQLLGLDCGYVAVETPFEFKPQNDSAIKTSGPNFMALLTVTTESALTKEGILWFLASAHAYSTL